MRLTRLFVFGISILLLTSANLSAQNPGTLQFNTKTVGAIVQTANLFISVFGEKGSHPDGLSEFATIFVLDFATNQFSNCHSRNLNLVANNGVTALSFLTEEGENCVIGQEIKVTACERIQNTRVFHRNVNGITSVGGEHFTTHGVEYSASPLACVLHAFGVDYDAFGAASSSQLISTP